MIIAKNGLKLIRHEEPDPNISEILHDPTILENLSEARSYTAPMPANICFRIEKDNKVIGQICLKSIKWINHKAGISLFISKKHQAQGHGLQTLRAIIEYAFKRLNLYRLEAEVIDGNAPSLKLLEKTGFTEEGRLREAKYVNGEYKDLLRFGLLRKEYSG
ncbi:MAG: GNAT family N-acetyltransferase [Bacteroidales bacterium]|nr:GNAT family N-acetyltransferase [Bacteroidales bacterium]